MSRKICPKNRGRDFVRFFLILRPPKADEGSHIISYTIKKLCRYKSRCYFTVFWSIPCFGRSKFKQPLIKCGF